MKEVITFGEVMIRLAPPGALRITQTRSFDFSFGGAEVNVAVSLANYGVPVSFVSRLPENDLADTCLQTLRQYIVGTDKIVRGGNRMGIYYLEAGAAQRGSKVIYDRAGSAIAMVEPGMIDWEAVFRGAGWFHWTGITPAISAGAATECLTAVKTAKKMGVIISCDFNYRKNLWKWGKTPGEIMSELVSYCDLAIGNEEDSEKVFGIKAPESDVLAGKVEAESYQYVCRALVERFPGLKSIAFTLRGSISASHNTWSGLLYHNGAFFTAPVYDIHPIVDRVGGGDSFGGGLIYSLLKAPDQPQRAINFAVAASCLKHSIMGDFNCVTVAEVEKLMGGDASGRVSR
jgi:2-dehydro-3-deoxygluconokinase